MEGEFSIIIKKLTNIEQLIQSQNILQKDILNFEDACIFLDLSSSCLYKLTSKNLIPCSCPNGKKIYFKKIDLEAWMITNPKKTVQEIDKIASDFIIKTKK